MNKIRQACASINNWFKQNGFMLFLIVYSVLLTTHALKTKPITIIIHNNPNDDDPIIQTITEESLVNDSEAVLETDTYIEGHIPDYSENVTESDDRFEKESGSSSVSYLMLEDDHKLSEWDLLRKGTYKMAKILKLNYPDIPMSQLYLYDSCMKIFYIECKFKQGDGAVNNISDARGLIQFMPSTRKSLNIPDNVHKMALHEQLPYVEKYIMYKIKTHNIKTNKLNDFIDIYMIVLSPAHADKHMDVKLFDDSCKERCGKYRNGKKWCAYHANECLDANRSGRITKREVRTWALAKFQTKYK